MRLCFMVYTTAERRTKAPGKAGRLPTGGGKTMKGDGRRVMDGLCVLLAMIIEGCFKYNTPYKTTFYLLTFTYFSLYKQYCCQKY